MNLNSVKIKKIIEKIRVKKGFVFLLVATVVFLFVSYLTFFQSDPSEDEISEYSKSFESEYDKYGNQINNNNNTNIKNLIRSDQVKEIEYYGKLIEKKNYGNRRNPFVKPF